MIFILKKLFELLFFKIKSLKSIFNIDDNNNKKKVNSWISGLKFGGALILDGIKSFGNAYS